MTALLNLLNEMLIERSPFSEEKDKYVPSDEFTALCLLLRAKLERDRTSTPMTQVEAKSLTKRQCECMYWIAKGKSSWEVSQILNISENTVNYHIQRVLWHFKTSSRTVAAIKCVNQGFFNID